MTLKLRELIREVRQCKTAAEERACIAKECANIRTSFANNETQYRHRNVAKLLYIHMLGYPTAFGQMECMKIVVSNSYRDKRMGYLGLMLLLDERQEVLTLVTHSLQQDLGHSNQYVVGLALCSLANISSEDIARSLSPIVVKLLSSSVPYIRKKAALCAIRIVRKVPELMDQFIDKVRPLLAERHHGVLITGISLMIEMCEQDEANLKIFRKLTPALVKILKNLVLSGYAPEHDVNGVTDPFLQVKLLKLLRLIGRHDTQASDAMNDILAQVATNTESTRNVGNAILYECVQTIMHIESESGLRVLAINILGRFLLNRDNNIRYVALNTLQRVVAADHQAVQRHRPTIVECLKDHDVSIRRRALDLIYALVNESNIKTLMKELLNFLLSSDYESRVDLTAKICYVTEKYAPTPRWHLDTILRVMAISGDYVPEEVIANTAQLVITNTDLQVYAVKKLFVVLCKEQLRQPLVQTGVWCVGEYGDLLLDNDSETSIEDVVELFQKVLRHPISTDITKQYVLAALIKLTDRLKNRPNCDQLVLGQLNQYKQHLSLELQQRACEYSSLLAAAPADVRGTVLEKVPPLEENEESAASKTEPASGTAQAKPAEAVSAAAPAATPNLLGDILSSPAPAAAAVPAGGDLLSGLLGGGPAGAAAPAAAPASAGGLLDLLGGSPAPQTAPAAAPLGGAAPASAGGLSPAAAQANAATGSGIPSLTIYEKSGLKIVFDFLKKPDDVSVTLITTTATNASETPIQNVSLQAAVPKYVRIQVKPPSTTTIPPCLSGVMSQQMIVGNSLHGQKGLAMKIKLEFDFGTQHVSELLTVVNFPKEV